MADKAVGDYTLGQLSHVLGTTSASIVARAAANNMPGQGRLNYTSTSVVTFVPFDGNQIKINGVSYQIPTAGVTLAYGSLTVDTLYYVYAYISGSTLTLEASATTHATSSTSGNEGVEIKSGDDTRSLVGMVFTTGSAFADIRTLSWFNRRLKTVTANLGNLSTASTTIVIVGAVTVACNWANDPVFAYWWCQAATAGTNGQHYVCRQTTATIHASIAQFTYISSFVPCVFGGIDAGATEGANGYYAAMCTIVGVGITSANNSYMQPSVLG